MSYVNNKNELKNGLNMLTGGDTLNVWLIQTGEPLPTTSYIKRMRTAILADKLIQRGHEVLWFTSAFDHLKKEWLFHEDSSLTLKDGLKIIALKGIGYKNNFSFYRYLDHKIIARKFKKLSYKMPKPDVIITSIPTYDLSYEAVKYAKSNNIPAIVDIRDPWPDIFLKHVPYVLQKLAKLFLYKDFQILRETIQEAVGLIAVTKTFLQWGLSYSERERRWVDQVFYLGQLRLQENNGNTKINHLLEDRNSKFVATFVGTFAKYHNPSIILDCAQRLTKHNILFVLAGKGEYFAGIEKRASNMDNVLLTGWLNNDEIVSLLQLSHIGLCPTSQHIDLFPNKAFTYLSAGLPVISAFHGDLKEIIDKYSVGLYYRPNDVDGFADCIRRLHEDRELYKHMSKNAQRVFDEMFDAECIYTKYVEHIEKIVCKKSPPHCGRYEDK